MGQARQGEVGAQGVEQGQGPIFARVRGPKAVGDLVADRGQFGRWKVQAEVCGGGLAVAEPHRAVQDVRKGDLLAGADHLRLDIEVGQDQRQLLDQIGPEQVRPGDGGLVGPALAEAGIGPGQARRGALGHIGQAQLGIGVGAGGAGDGVGRGVVAQIGPKIGAKLGDRAIVLSLQAVDQGDGVVFESHAGS